LHSIVKRILENPEILKILQNGPWFDNRVLTRYGIAVCNFMDTRDMRRCLVSTSRLSLAYMTSIYTDFPAWKETEDDK
jgi:ribonuclease D